MARTCASAAGSRRPSSTNAAQVWNLTLDDGGTLQAAAVVCAVGQLGRPALPDIAGRDGFAGPSWHSARWNHDVDLAGRRVAVVGTGASAIQFVPEIAKVAGHVDVYQRSAPYVLPKADRPYRDAEQALYDRLPVVRKADRLRIFLYGELLTSGFVLSPKLLAGPMQLWRRQLRTQIADPELRAKCVPDYVMGCKRVVFSNDWYPALARPNVELVTDPIERIVPDGVVTADGTTRTADVIIYGTGFKAVEFLAPMLVSGLDGSRLQQAWQDGPQAYLGITVSGFPNFFMLYGPNTNLGGNSIIYMLEGQIGYVLGAIQALEAERLAWLDVRPDVQDAFNSWVQSASRTSVWESGCHSWYTTASGRNTNNWPDHTFMYRYRVRRFDLGRVPGHAETAGHGRHRRQRGMTARRARRGLRVPPAVMRLGVRQLGRRCLDPALPWPVQRTRLDQLTRISLLPRGTTVAEQTIAGVRAEVVSCPGDRVRSANHGDPLSRRRLLRRLGAHGPVVGGAPERPDGLPGRAARVPPGPRASLSGGAGGRPRGADSAVRRGGRVQAGLGGGVGRLGGRRDSPWPWSCRCATRARSCRAAASCCRRGSISAATAGPSRTWCAGTSCSTRTGSTPAPARTPTRPPGPTTWSPRCAPRTLGCRRC